MSASHVAILYWTNSTIMWGKVVPDNHGTLAALRHNPPAGTSIIFIPIGQPYDDTTCRAAIAAKTGVPTPSDICGLLDDNHNVIAVVRACPMNCDPTKIHNGKGKTLRQHDLVGIGDRWNPALNRFERFFSVADSTRTVTHHAWLPVENPHDALPEGSTLTTASVPIGHTLAAK